MTEKNENPKVTMDLNSEHSDRFGYVPPNLTRDVEERGYVPPAIERHPTPMSSSGSSDSGTDSDQSSSEQPAEEQSQ